MLSETSVMRRYFIAALWRGLRITWPIMSAGLLLQFALGSLVRVSEEWSLGSAWYFTSITGLTIGYGDLVPRTLLGRVLSIAIGIIGILLTALVAAIAVRALQETLIGKDGGPASRSPRR